jgi:DNA-binding transcriptional MerR regulator
VTLQSTTTKSATESPSRDDPKSSMLKISQLARRTGASRATIQHYLREGLLPAPVKTGRTMAYYDPSCVDRILLIKELQRRYLPLGVIRQLVESPPKRQGAGRRGLAALAAVSEEIRAAVQPAERPLLREEVQAQTHVEPETLEVLERMGIVRATKVWEKEVFGPADTAVLRAVGKLQSAGIRREIGFRPQDIAIYRDAMTRLLEKEVGAFGRSVLLRRPKGDVVRLAIAAATGATELMVAIRNKLIAELISSALPAEKGHAGGRRGQPR